MDDSLFGHASGDDAKVREDRGVGALVRRAAEILDAAGNRDAAISVSVTRTTLMRHGFKPDKRGAPLKHCGHTVYPAEASQDASEEQQDINLEK